MAYVPFVRDESQEKSAVVPPKDLGTIISLNANFVPLVSGKRRLWLSENLGITVSEARVSANEYDGRLAVRDDNLEYEYSISWNDLTSKEMISVHSAGRNDWTVATWESTSESSFRRCYREPLAKIEEIKHLPERWDSYEAVCISSETGARAIQVLGKAFQVFNTGSEEPPVPFVSPCPDGSIELEWGKNGKELEIVIPFSEGEKISVLKVLENGEVVESSVDSSSEVSQFLLWLMED